MVNGHYFGGVVVYNGGALSAVRAAAARDLERIRAEKRADAARVVSNRFVAYTPRHDVQPQRVAFRPRAW